jgi:hypothetical protein
MDKRTGTLALLCSATLAAGTVASMPAYARGGGNSPVVSHSTAPADHAEPVPHASGRQPPPVGPTPTCAPTNMEAKQAAAPGC